jgi:hypothetical protein
VTTLTPPEHEHTEAVLLAAQWLADEQSPPQPIIPSLRSRFGLSAIEATEACAMAQRFRTVRKAFG